MQRRKFLGLGFGVAALSLAPISAVAKNYRKELPNAWKIKNKEAENDLTGTNEAIKAVFGNDKTEDGQIKLKAPDIAENGAVVPVSFKLEKASKVALFQSANPEALVAVWDIPEAGIPDYGVRIKMAKTGTITVVAEVDGKLYRASKVVKVTAGGCGG
jgi:sulfur-oxidizing protein SoxY